MKGIVSRWNQKLYLGTIVVILRGAPTQRYFFFGDRILVGPEPTIGSEVEFEVDTTKPVLPGKLPVAVSIKVLEPEAGLDALAGGAL